jgi:uncharacterized protein YkwD
MVMFKRYRCGLLVVFGGLAPCLVGCGVAASRPPEPVPGIQEVLLAEVNAFRAETRQCGAEFHAPAPPLRWSATLEQAAQAHAVDMARHDLLSHTGSDGRRPAERIDAAGYTWSTIAENVAAGQTSAEEALATWKASPGHCSNLMIPDVSEVGVGAAVNADSDYGYYWSMKLAAPQP